jgi:succinate dehydrogenase/fumarate reductase flavoprotein subunit
MSDIRLFGRPVRVSRRVYDALVVGTGAAGFNAAVHLKGFGAAECALVSEGRLMGVSRNTGSDKQTYYKTGSAGAADSPRGMAEALFAGGAMDGDVALCEASQSLQEFFHLVTLGVAFPHSMFGEFPGYQTDHDASARASSTGPYTSKAMTEALEREAARLGVPVIDDTRVVQVLVEEGRAYGLLCLEQERDFVLYFAENIIFATGGDAGLYGRTVYPPGHFGASGVLARAGVSFANMTEWQYGIGSVGFRWNLSGSYQQVIPRYVVRDGDGAEREFLHDWFPSLRELVRAVFLKGYQWPFDSGKVGSHGSSLIDAAIYVERQRGGTVFLDFMHNPQGGGFDLDALPDEARDYLAKSDALAASPVERLERLNPDAVELYRAHGIDLRREYLEIDVLPQHHNGGAEINIWWETSVKHLFAVGECAGSHGVRRPGGSALNAGQVGGLRAAEYIARCRLVSGRQFPEGAAAAIARAAEAVAGFERSLGAVVVAPAGAGKESAVGVGKDSAVAVCLRRVQDANARSAAFLRSRAGSAASLALFAEMEGAAFTVAADELGAFFRFKEALLLSRLLHHSIIHYIDAGGLSRGSSAILEGALRVPLEGFPQDTAFHDAVLLTRCDEDGGIHSVFRPVRPIPDSDLWFEKVWRDYREGRIFTGCPE